MKVGAHQINMKPKCIFCKIVAREIPAHVIYEDEACLAFLDIHPSDNGHTLVIPKKHVASFGDADTKSVEAVAQATQKVRHLLEKKLRPKGFNLVINDGKAAFQEVFHYHQHVIPKYGPNEGYYPGKNPFNRESIAEIERLIKE